MIGHGDFPFRKGEEILVLHPDVDRPHDGVSSDIIDEAEARSDGDLPDGDSEVGEDVVDGQLSS